MLVVVTNGLIEMLSDIKSGLLTTGPPKLRLFKNDYTPLKGDTISAYTEADFTGYAALDIVAGDWSTPSATGGGDAITENVNKVFLQTGTGTTCMVYGYYVTDPANSQLYWAERSGAGGFNMNTVGLTYTVKPTLTLTDIT